MAKFKFNDVRCLVVLYPLLFAVYPVLELFFKLSPGIPFGESVRALLVAPAVVGLCLWGWQRLEHDGHRAAYLTTLMILAFFYYGSLYSALWNLHIGAVRIGRHIILFPLWVLMLGILGSKWAWRRFRAPQMITAFLSITIAVAMLFSAGRYVLKRSAQAPAAATARASAVVRLAGDTPVQLERPSTLPDIYYIIPDSYARADVLRAFYGFDNAEFLEALRARGFYVAEESRSNYLQTALSLASSLNMEYLEATTLDAADRAPLAELVQHSKVRALLAELGYRLVVAESGYDITEIKDAEVYWTPNPHPILNTFENLLVISSAAVIAIDQGWLSVPVAGRANRVQVQYALEQLPAAAALPGPKFVFFHIITPHPPFVIDRDGRFTAPLSPNMGSFDGDAMAGPPDLYIAGYVEKLLYTNAMLLQAIDAILARSTTPPIIVIQADHGSGMLWRLNLLEDTCIWERAAIFNAYYLPAAGAAAQLYPEITPVNTFRVILDTHFGATLGALADRVYYSSWKRPYQFTDVTDRAGIPCPAP